MVSANPRQVTSVSAVPVTENYGESATTAMPHTSMAAPNAGRGKASSRVPTMKPSCTAETTIPNDVPSSRTSRSKLGSTALPANHREVHANCANTMVGNIHRGRWAGEGNDRTEAAGKMSAGKEQALLKYLD